MIYKMLVLVGTFLVIYLLGLVTFSCVATLTLTEKQEFENLFEALRTNLGVSLGDFDLEKYDELEGWKKYYGLILEICVIFTNMILMINLLIAMMSDMYVSLSEVKLGLFWAQVILELPRYEYHPNYGLLSMSPFIYSWFSFLCIPALIIMKDNERVLRKINNVFFLFVYFPISLVLLAIFMSVNMALIPYAYVKTIIHKSLLVSRYKSKNYS